MSYNYFKEIAKWNKWKKKEEQLLRMFNFSEEKIKALREYDRLAFNKERNFRLHENITDEKLFKSLINTSGNEITSFEELLDVIENEALYEIIRRQDKETIKIIILKLYGYSVKEIAELLEISVKQVYYRIKKLKNFYKSVKNQRFHCFYSEGEFTEETHKNIDN